MQKIINEAQWKKITRREAQIFRIKNYIKEVWRILKDIETMNEEIKTELKKK